MTTGHAGQTSAGLDTGKRDERLAGQSLAFEASFRDFIRIVEENLALRRDAANLFRKLHRKLAGGGHLTSRDQLALKQELGRYRESYEKLRSFAGALGDWGDETVTIVFPASDPSGSAKNPGLLGFGTGTSVRINPEDDHGQLLVLDLKMWLAARLVVLDNFAVIVARYLKRADERRQFDLATIDPQAKSFLEEVHGALLDANRYRGTRRAIDLVARMQRYEVDHPGSNLSRNKDNSYLNTLISGSYSYHRIPELTVPEQDALEAAGVSNAFVDELVSLSDNATHGVSELFGNVIGLYEERKGKLYGKPELARTLTGKLKLLDVLLEKTPFRLTDRFIPGHWGHVAIWVGDSSAIPELKRLGVWAQLPKLEARARAERGYSGPSFQNLIAANRGVLEALRPGVQLNHISGFLNIDDLAVLRGRNLTDNQKRYYLLRAFSQVGKDYDFNFDVETHRQIVCSELAYIVFDDYPWPVQQTLGRYTVSPDHVAALALDENQPFAPVILIHDGVELPLHANRGNLIHLLKEEYEKVVFD